MADYFFHRELESTLKKATQSISLIAGVYGDDNEEIKQEIKSELLVEEVDGVYDELNDDDTIQKAGDISHIYFDYEDKDKIPIKEESIKKEIKTEEPLHKDHIDGISMSKIKDEKIEMPNLESDSEVSKDTFQENNDEEEEEFVIEKVLGKDHISLKKTFSTGSSVITLI